MHSPDHSERISSIAQVESDGSEPTGSADEFGFDRQVAEVRPAERSAIEIDACPVCGNGTATPRFSIDGMTCRVVVCEQCSLGRLWPEPSVETISSFYPSEYYGTSGAKFERLVEAMVRFVGARQVRWLARGLPERARVLDVGCGRGVLLSALADRGFEAHGFEISRMAAEGADPRAKIRIADNLLKAKYPDGFFDEVILWHVLEHVSNPRETLMEIQRILKPGGRLAVSVPNFSSIQARWAGAAWFHLDLPRHVFHFPSRALRQLLEVCGFRCLREHHFSLRQNPFGWVQSFLNGRGSFPRNGLYSMLKRRVDGTNEYFRPRARWKMKAVYYFGMPLAVAGSILTASLRSGASVCIVAESERST